MCALYHSTQNWTANTMACNNSVELEFFCFTFLYGRCTDLKMSPLNSPWPIWYRRFEWSIYKALSWCPTSPYAPAYNVAGSYSVSHPIFRVAISRVRSNIFWKCFLLTWSTAHQLSNKTNRSSLSYFVRIWCPFEKVAICRQKCENWLCCPRAAKT